jgi:hypothetical protein
MPDTKNRKAKLLHKLHAQEDPTAKADVDSSTEPNPPIIELDDRSVGSEAEINRLKSKLITVMEEINQLRNENLKFSMDHEKLKSEFRELKLVLARFEVRELRAVERVNSWMRSFNLLREMVGSSNDRKKKRAV